MNRGYRAAVLAILAVVALQGWATAGNVGGPGSPQSFSCFYECKPGPMVDGKPTWREITTLMIGSAGGSEVSATTNGGTLGGPIDANISIYDGNSNLVAQTWTTLVRNDLDEVNVCATIRNVTSCIGPEGGACQDVGPCCPGLICAGVNGTSHCVPDDYSASTQGVPSMGGSVPEAGFIRINLSNDIDWATTAADASLNAPGGCISEFSGPCDGIAPCCNPSFTCVGFEGASSCQPIGGSASVSVWVKNLLGRFFVERDEPFEGRVTGVAKTQCMAGPPSQKRIIIPIGYSVDPVLVENTADEENGSPCGDSYPACNGECPPGAVCVEQGMMGTGATTSGLGCQCVLP